jgi:hypothetical protein
MNTKNDDFGELRVFLTHTKTKKKREGWIQNQNKNEEKGKMKTQYNIFFF